MKNHVGRTIGVIQVLNKRRARSDRAQIQARHDKADVDESATASSQHDEELLTALATQAAVSIDNSRLFLSVIQKNMQLVDTKEQLEHRVSDLKLLFDLESAMGRADHDRGPRARRRPRGGARVRARERRRPDGRRGRGRRLALLSTYFVDLSGARAEEEAQSRWSREAPRASSVGDAPGRQVGHFVPPAPSRSPPHALPIGEGILGSRRWSLAQRGASHDSARAFPPTDIFAPRGGARGPVSKRACGSRRSRCSGIRTCRSRALSLCPLEGADDDGDRRHRPLQLQEARSASRRTIALLRSISANASTALQLFRSRIEQEKSERLSAIGRLISGVMHDMRTPLTVISGYVQLMTNANDPPRATSTSASS
jgi:hypothetical protein